MQGRRDKSFSIVFGSVPLKSEGMPAPLHTMACVNCPRNDETVEVTLQSLVFNPRPNLFLIKFCNGRFCLESLYRLLHPFQLKVGAHPLHLPLQQFMVAENKSSLFEVLWFVIRNQHPRRFLSRQKADDAQALNIVLLPVQCAHGDDVARASFEGFNCRFHVRQLLEEKVPVFAMGLHGAFNVKANAIVA